MRSVLAVGTALLLAGAVIGAAETAGTKYGTGVAVQQATSIADVAAKPDQFVGKTVRVDGVVEAVCENMGCWMQLKDEKSASMLRIKVDDGVIVFPVTAKGKKASAEGVIEKVDVVAENAHHAEMAAKEVKDATKTATDAAHAAHATPAATKATYQLKATGALIY
jgi:hypothetical protein